MMEIQQVNIECIGLNSLSPKDEDYKKVGKELFKAFENIGFVYTHGHGVSNEIITNSMQTSKEFFTLSLEEKKQMLKDPKTDQGYVAAGQELFTPEKVRILS